MRRTVSKMGNSSLVMSLPHKWVKENNINQGDELFVEEFEKGLVVSQTQFHRKEKNLEMDVSTLHDRTVLNILNYAYRSGHIKIILNCKDDAQIAFVSEVTHTHLLGFEVVEEKGKKCVIENIAEPSMEKTDVIIRKIFLLIKQLADKIYSDVSQNQLINTKRINQMRTTIDYFTNFARRTTLQLQYGGKERSYYLWSIISSLSLVAHAYGYLYEQLSSQQNLREVSGYVLKINQLFDDVYRVFYKQDYSLLDKIDSKRKKITQDLFNANLENTSVCYLYELARHIQLTSSRIFGWHLNESDTAAQL